MSDTTLCPTCGNPVRIVGHTTKHYEPLEADEIWNEAIEAAAKEALRIWHEATNERTESIFTSFLKNKFQDGCLESAKKIRTLKREDKEKRFCEVSGVELI